MSVIFETLRTLRKRQHYFIDRRFQLQMAKQFLLVLALGVVLVFGNLYVIRTLAGNFDTTSLTTSNWFQITVLAGYCAVLAGVSSGIVFSLSLVYAHRLAGPAMKIVSALQRMADGEDPGRITLRQSDMLNEVAGALNLLSFQRRAEIAELREAVQAAKASDEPLELRSALGRLERIAGEPAPDAAATQ